MKAKLSINTLLRTPFKTLLGASICAVIVTRRRPLELLQVKE